MNDCAPPPAADTTTPDYAPLPMRTHDVVALHAFVRDQLTAQGATRSDATAQAAEFVAASLLATDHGRRDVDPGLEALCVGAADERAAAFIAEATAELDEGAVERQVRIVRRMVGLAPVPTRPTGHAPVAFLPHAAAFAPTSGVTLPLRSFVGPQ